MNIHKNNFFLASLFIGGLLSSACAALAQNAPLTIPAQPTVSDDIAKYLRWVFDAGIAIGFISILIAIAVSGFYFIFSTAAPALRSKAKEWLTGAISGLVVFLLLYLILSTVNPNLVIFKIGKPLNDTFSVQGQGQKTAGVYLYESSGCTGDPINIRSNSAAFNSPKKVGSIQVVSDSETGDKYFSVIYDRNNYEGACQYVTTGCFDVNIGKISSLIVRKVDSAGSGDITLYRNPSFKQDGGYLTVQAAPLFEKNLKDLQFTGSPGSDQCNVPADQQDCTQWDNKGNCVQKSCPNLQDENISSISLDGDFVAVLSYWGPNNKDSTTQTFCQTYPDASDINASGPKQIKWDPVNNDIDDTSKPFLPYYPNFIRIISVK